RAPAATRPQPPRCSIVVAGTTTMELRGGSPGVVDHGERDGWRGAGTRPPFGIKDGTAASSTRDRPKTIARGEHTRAPGAPWEVSPGLGSSGVPGGTARIAPG